MTASTASSADTTIPSLRTPGTPIAMRVKTRRVDTETEAEVVSLAAGIQAVTLAAQVETVAVDAEAKFQSCLVPGCTGLMIGHMVSCATCHVANDRKRRRTKKYKAGDFETALCVLVAEAHPVNLSFLFELLIMIKLQFGHELPFYLFLVRAFEPVGINFLFE